MQGCWNGLTWSALTYLFAFLVDVCVTPCYRAIGALSSDIERESKLRHHIDQITSHAVELGILFRRPGTSSYNNNNNDADVSQPKIRRFGVDPNKNNGNNNNIYDLSCLSFPVARAACRYVLMKRILPLSSNNHNNNDKNRTTIDIPDVMFITGSGLQHRLIGAANHGASIRDSNNNNSIVGIQQQQQHQPRSSSMFMREYVQYMLWNDFHLISVISNRTSLSTTTTTSITGGSNAVTVKGAILKEWCINNF